jgi:hypothetical protein
MYQLIIWICGKLWNHGNWVDPFFDMAAMRLELQPWIQNLQETNGFFRIEPPKVFSGPPLNLVGETTM